MPERCCLNWTYINVEPYDGVLLAIALESCNLGLELVVLLLALRPCAVVSLGLLARLGGLVLSVRVLRQLRRIVAGLLLLLVLLLVLRGVRFAVRCRRSVGAVALGAVPHVSILLRVLAVR